MKRGLVLAGGLLLVLGVVNAMIVGKERLLAGGVPMFFELAPVDPRALMQGDYMQLRYTIGNEIERREWPGDGVAVVRLDPRGVAGLVRRHLGEELAAGEHLVRYRTRNGDVYIGSDAFFFEEGQAEVYERAAHGELVADEGGATVLIGLRDDSLAPLGTPLH